MTDTGTTEPTETKDDESGHDRYEVMATVLLGLAAVAIAFSAYQSSLWGGQQDTALTDSVRANSAAVDAYQRADTTLTSDQTLFIELLVSNVCFDDRPEYDLEICTQIFGSLSLDGQLAVDEWIAGRQDFPFQSQAYIDVLYTDGNVLTEASDDLFDDAQRFNKNGDEYELGSTLLTTVLFFAGISLVLGNDRLRRLLLGLAAVLLTGSAVYLTTLSRTF